MQPRELGKNFDEARRERKRNFLGLSGKDARVQSAFLGSGLIHTKEAAAEAQFEQHRILSFLIFKIDTVGTLSVVFGFPGNAGGKQPSEPFAVDAAGDICGTASGGNAGTRVVFKVTPEKEETILHTFSDDAYHVGLVMAAAGNLYGTSTSGGGPDLGYVWRLTKEN